MAWARVKLRINARLGQFLQLLKHVTLSLIENRLVTNVGWRKNSESPLSFISLQQIKMTKT